MRVGTYTVVPIHRQHRTWLMTEMDRIFTKLQPETLVCSTDLVGHCTFEWAENHMTPCDIVVPWEGAGFPQPIEREDVSFRPWGGRLQMGVGSEGTVESWNDARLRVLENVGTLVLVTSRLNVAGPWLTRARMRQRQVVLIELVTKRTSLRREETDHATDPSQNLDVEPRRCRSSGSSSSDGVHDSWNRLAGGLGPPRRLSFRDDRDNCHRDCRGHHGPARSASRRRRPFADKRIGRDVSTRF